MTRRNPLLPVIWLGAVLSLAAALYLVYESGGGATWQPTTGKLIDFVKPVAGSDGRLFRVVYSYEVDGQWFHGMAITEEEIKIKPGLPYTVLYNTERPAVSRLEADPPWLLVGMWLLLGGVFVLLAFWSQRSSSRSES